MKNKNLLFLMILFLYSATQAVIIAGGNGSGNTNGSGVIGWDYVGRISSSNGAPSSVTYLGNSWFITAYHVKQLDNPTGVILNATSYTINTSSWTRITNSTGSGADLVLFKANSTVSGIVAPTISSDPLANGANLTMIGNGVDRYSTQQTWILQTNPLRYEQGYYFHSYTNKNTVKRWGYNNVEGSINGYNSGYGLTDSLYTDFDNVVGEAQGVYYDSGGGVFSGATNSWELSGIVIGMGNTFTINGTNAVFFTGNDPQYNGGSTYIADLSKYRNQINQVIPEPSTGVLLVGIGIVFGVIKRLRYMYQ